MVFKSLTDGVNCYRTRFTWDGSERDFNFRAYEVFDKTRNKKNKIGITRILPDVRQLGGDIYAICFNNMKKGDVKEIEVEFYELSDTKKAMNKEHSRTSDSKVDEMNLSASFNEPKKFNVEVSNRFDASQRPLEGYPRLLEGISGGNEAIWEIHKERPIKTTERYKLTWDAC